jgi:hypothetical protein
VSTQLNTSLQMQFRVIDGLMVRFAHSLDRGGHAQLVSPWPGSLLAFEPIWARLAERTYLVATDLPGFGDSQRFDTLLFPKVMGEFIIRAADPFGLRHPHVIAPMSVPRQRCSLRPGTQGRLRSLVIGSAAPWSRSSSVSCAGIGGCRRSTPSPLSSGGQSCVWSCMFNTRQRCLA